MKNPKEMYKEGWCADCEGYIAQCIDIGTCHGYLSGTRLAKFFRDPKLLASRMIFPVMMRDGYKYSSPCGTFDTYPEATNAMVKWLFEKGDV